MGFGRNVGAALTFGLSATTRKKEAEVKHQARLKKHAAAVAALEEAQASFRATFEEAEARASTARNKLIESGALTLDADNNVVLGWYTPDPDAGEMAEGPDVAQSLIASIPAFGLAVGTPAAVWTLVSLYGAASTGVAISSLSGAAAGAATAAWIGRAATLGLGGGMTVGRFALGPIGLAASLATIPLGAAVARSQERKFIGRAEEIEAGMDALEHIYLRFQRALSDLRPRVAVVSDNLLRHTSQLETADPEEEMQAAAGRLDTDLREFEGVARALVDAATTRDEAFAEKGFI